MVDSFYGLPYRSLTKLTGYLKDLSKSRLWMKILFAMVLGISVGILFGPSLNLVEQETAKNLGNWLALPGQVFLGLIQMIVVPLVFASIVTGLTAGEDMEQLRQMGVKLVIYFVITTTLAITIGVAVASIIRPGEYIDSSLLAGTSQAAPLEQGEVPSLGFSNVPEVIVNLLPQNPLESMVNNEMLQVVLFAVIFGIAMVMMPVSQSKPLLDLFVSLQEICMTVVRWAMLMAPLAVFGLLAQITMKIGLGALVGMAVYMATVIGGLFILLLFYLLIVSVISRKSPFWFLSSVREVQLLAFSTSSSAAVMPLSMETAEKKLGVRPGISRFLVPLGATINMDGTALYQGVAAIFLAQVFGIDLSLSSIMLIIVTAVGASIGAPATPGVGIVILSMVLNNAGIPASGIALIIGVDRILDMSRTAINVTGDLTACMVMDRWVKLKKVSAE